MSCVPVFRHIYADLGSDSPATITFLLDRHGVSFLPLLSLMVGSRAAESEILNLVTDGVQPRFFFN